MPIIEVNHVTKEFKLGQLTSLKQTALNTLNRLTGRPLEERKPFKGLDNVTFSVEQGEVGGIIGANGVGKSTLLKMLAKISTLPTDHYPLMANPYHANHFAIFHGEMV